MARRSKKAKPQPRTGPAVNDAPNLTREQARSAIPVNVPIIEREELSGGGARLTYLIKTGGWTKVILRLPPEVDKTVELDEVGLEVFDQCDGTRPVSQIVKHYARRYRVDHHEAEIAVTTFLKTLMHRGLVTMVVPR